MQSRSTPTAHSLARGRLEDDRANERDVAIPIVRSNDLLVMKALAKGMGVARLRHVCTGHACGVAAFLSLAAKVQQGRRIGG